jgi:predicted phosphodiesterase
MKDRQRIYRETAENPNCLEISFKGDVLLNFMSDMHVGGAETDYQRIDQEIDAIVRTPNSYVWVLGDEIDAFFFLPAAYDAQEQTQQQYEYMYAMFKHLAEHKKLLIGTAGNHTLWIGRSGVNPYTHFTRETGAYFTHGMTYLTARVDEQIYKITANHELRGQSMYTHTHPQKRAYRFGSAQGSDVVVSGHWHTKEISQQGIGSFGEQSEVVTFIALGTYKAYDEYTRTKGFAKRTPNEMFGASIALRADKKQIKPFYDILEAHEDFISLSARKHEMVRT